MSETPNPHILDADTMTGGMRPIRQAVLALGSNLGEKLTNIQGAVESIADTPDVTLVSVSPVYESKPVGGPADAEDFLNAVVLIDTTLTVHTLLDRCLAIEDAYGRERSEADAPRTLDVDLIVVGDRIAEDDKLVLPHPRAHERAFVMRPWLDLDLEGEIPGRGYVIDLIGSVDEGGITKREDLEIVP